MLIKILFGYIVFSDAVLFWAPLSFGGCGRIGVMDYLAAITTDLIMRWIKWLGLAAGIVLIASCFMVWMELPARDIVVTGVETGNTSFGKPGYMHLILGSIFIILHLIPKLWAKRANLIVVAINLAWAVRNFFVITACRAGECPEKHTGIYLVLAASIALLIAGLFPDMKLPRETATPVSNNAETTTP